MRVRLEEVKGRGEVGGEFAALGEPGLVSGGECCEGNAGPPPGSDVFVDGDAEPGGQMLGHQLFDGGPFGQVPVSQQGGLVQQPLPDGQFAVVAGESLGDGGEYGLDRCDRVGSVRLFVQGVADDFQQLVVVGEQQLDLVREVAVKGPW